MSGISESDEDSDLEVQKPVKKLYTKQTRELTSSTKKQKTEEVVDEYDSDDEAYHNMLKSGDHDENEEDDFERQLRLEKEEAERKKVEKEEKKTRIDPDGTEYEYDPVVKGWFPKVDKIC